MKNDVSKFFANIVTNTFFALGVYWYISKLLGIEMGNITLLCVSFVIMMAVYFWRIGE